MTALLSVLVLVSLTGCLKKDKQGECVFQGDCGDGQACIEGACTDVSCTASSDCDIHQFCNKKYSCEDGCRTADDCQAGELCGQESHQCQAYGCRDTQLDCEIGQYCDTTTGQCYDDTKPNCASCDAGSSNACGGSGTCFVFQQGDTCNNDSQCPSGWYCDQFAFGEPKYCHEDFCMVTCNLNDAEPCPRGYQCGLVGATNPNNYCYAECSWLNENQ